MDSVVKMKVHFGKDNKPYCLELRAYFVGEHLNCFGEVQLIIFWMVMGIEEQRTDLNSNQFCMVS